jgi:glyoxylase-like metal-dependent hydrolase (beta-lactamase superfamily II)
MLRHAIALSLIAVTVATAAENPETLVEESQSRARAVLDKAVDALGGAEALRGIERVRLRLEGDTHPRLQMPTAAPPFEGGTLRETLLVDLEENRLRLEQRVTGAGFEGHNTIVINDGEGTNYDHRARTQTAIPAAQASQQQFTQYYRRLPNLLLQQALARANTLRYLGDGSFDGRPHEVFTFVMADTQQVAVYVDAKSGLVSKYELIFVDSLTGEDASEIMWGDYTKAGAYQVPRTWRNRLAGEIVADYKITAELNPAVNEQSFTVPEAAGFAKVEPPPLNLEENVEKLAEGLFVIQNVAGQNQNTLAVEFEDHIVAVEAPGTSQGADDVIARIKETIPGKPIRYVVMTHHHGDHIGGLRSFIAEGATVVTTPGNRQVVETMAAAKQNDRLTKNPRAPKLQMIERGKHVLSDGSRRLELIDIGPNPHAKEMVVAWLPKERVLFQGDLFFLPVNPGPLGPPQPTTVSFAKKLQELRLDVDRIASVHGRTATIADFRKATAGGP